ncbi:hypothetical protein [Streptomyces chartreusis]
MSEVRVTDHTARLYEELRAASAARLKWETYEKDLKSKILESLGYGGEGKPETKAAFDAHGAPLFKVDVSPRKEIDRKRLARQYPAAYADCETTVYVKTIRPVKADET